MTRKYRRKASARTQLSVAESVTGCWEFKFPYNEPLKEELKNNIPVYGRKWEAANQHWLVNREFYPVLERLVSKYFSTTLPQRSHDPKLSMMAEVEFDLVYLAKLKFHPGTSEKMASGMVAKQWMLAFSENVLKDYFIPGFQDPNKQDREMKPATLYDTFSVGSKATEAEIKKAYRQLALIYHPDKNDDPDAHEQFLGITRAYEVLGDKRNRKRYDASLAFKNQSTLSRTKTEINRKNPWVGRKLVAAEKHGACDVQNSPWRERLSRP